MPTYELKSIVIHRGGPYGGHYHAFIRDDLGEGNWDLEVPDKFDSEPTVDKDDKNKEKKEGDEPKKADDEEEKKEEEEEKKDDDWIDEKTINWKSLSKKQKKEMQ